MWSPEAKHLKKTTDLPKVTLICIWYTSSREMIGTFVLVWFFCVFFSWGQDKVATINSIFFFHLLLCFCYFYNIMSYYPQKKFYHIICSLQNGIFFFIQTISMYNKKSQITNLFPFCGQKYLKSSNKLSSFYIIYHQLSTTSLLSPVYKIR